MTDDDAERVPDGIGEEHSRPHRGLRRHASPASQLVLTAVAAAALAGAFGASTTRHASSDVADLTVELPARIRSGELFEMRVTIRARRAVDSLVMAIDGALWKDMTVNTVIPEPLGESADDGELRFSFGRLEAGKAFTLKVDLQINPNITGVDAGRIAVLDGDRLLTRFEHRIRVLP